MLRCWVETSTIILWSSRLSRLQPIQSPESQRGVDDVRAVRPLFSPDHQQRRWLGPLENASASRPLIPVSFHFRNNIPPQGHHVAFPVWRRPVCRSWLSDLFGVTCRLHGSDIRTRFTGIYIYVQYRHQPPNASSVSLMCNSYVIVLNLVIHGILILIFIIIILLVITHNTHSQLRMHVVARQQTGRRHIRNATWWPSSQV